MGYAGTRNALKVEACCPPSTDQHLQEELLLLQLMNPLILHLNDMVQTLQLLLPEWAGAAIILEKDTEGPHQLAGSEGHGSPLLPTLPAAHGIGLV